MSRTPIASRLIRYSAVANRFSAAFVNAHNSDSYSIVGTLQLLNNRRFNFIAMFWPSADLDISETRVTVISYSAYIDSCIAGHL